MPDKKVQRPQARGMRRKPGPAHPNATVGKPVEAASYVLPEDGRLPAGWRVIGGREFSEQLLSIRFLVLIAIMGILGIVLIYVLSGTIRDFAGSLNDQRDYTGGKFPLFLALFTESSSLGQGGLDIPSFAGWITSIVGPLLGIAFGFDAISNERSEGTLPRLVSQPIYRDDVINGKFVAGISTIALIVGSVMTILAAVGIIRLGLIPNVDVLLRILFWFVMVVVYVGFWMALSLLFSVIFRRAATALLAVLAIWLVVTFFGSIIITILANVISPVDAAGSTASQLANVNLQASLGRILPNGQFDAITQVLMNPGRTFLGFTLSDPTGRAVPSLLSVSQSLLLIWPQIVSLIALTATCFAAAYVEFMRQEVRA